MTAAADGPSRVPPDELRPAVGLLARGPEAAEPDRAVGHHPARPADVLRALGHRGPA